MAELMTWNEREKRWYKKHNKQRFVVSCVQLGTPPTKRGSIAAANAWWQSKREEIDKQRAATRPNLNDWQRALAITRAKIRWLSRHKASPDFLKLLMGDNPAATAMGIEWAEKDKAPAENIIDALTKLATVFEKAPDGFFDQTAGMRMRREIYEVGDSRDINISIEKFLGRPRSINPFLKKIGIETK